jgi:ribonuclease HI
MSVVTNGDKAMTSKKCQVKTKHFYIDGAGQGPDGCGSGWAWVYGDQNLQRVRRIDHLTNNEAEYHGLIAALKYVSRGSSVLILTDSQLVCSQFAGKFRVKEPRLKRLLDQAKRLMEERNLQVELKWIPREENVAGKLLDRT